MTHHPEDERIAEADAVELFAKIIDPEAFGLPNNLEDGTITDRDEARDRARLVIKAAVGLKIVPADTIPEAKMTTFIHPDGRTLTLNDSELAMLGPPRGAVEWRPGQPDTIPVPADVWKQVTDAVAGAAEQFRFYEKQHMAKSPPDILKAQTNRQMAEGLEEALAAARNVGVGS